MKKKLTIITPCTRPENLRELAKSIEPGRGLFDLTWRVVFDGTCPYSQAFPGAIATVERWPGSAFGNYQRNRGLDETVDGWVYFLDDDNIIHPSFFGELSAAIRRARHAGAFAFGQILPKRVRLAAAENMRVRYVDIAQVCMRRSLIGSKRFDLEAYEADGLFIQAIYESNPTAWKFLDTALCYYNKLR